MSRSGAGNRSVAAGGGLQLPALLQFRMKELWAHMIVQFPDSPKLEKRIKKSTRLSEYTEAVNELFKEAGHGL